jgi:hypothetical protein
MIHVAPSFDEATPDEQALLDRFFEEHKGEALGNVADTVIFEDDKVRIWTLVLEPGQGSDLHRHDLDYYLCISAGDRIAGLMPKGDKATSYVVGIPPAGNTLGIAKGATEWAVNVGKVTYREILVELKNP